MADGLVIRGDPASSWRRIHRSGPGTGRANQWQAILRGLLEETLRSLDDDRFEANGKGRLYGT